MHYGYIFAIAVGSMLGQEGMGRKPVVASYLSGFLFAAGWWLLADGAAYAKHIDSPIQVSIVALIPGFVSTIGFFLMNSFPWTDLEDDGGAGKRGKILLASSIVFLLAGIFGSVWVFIERWANSGVADLNPWPGVALILQAVCIMLGAMLLRPIDLAWGGFLPETDDFGEVWIGPEWYRFEAQDKRFQMTFRLWLVLCVVQVLISAVTWLGMASVPVQLAISILA
eukprot:g23461.t1